MKTWFNLNTIFLLALFTFTFVQATEDQQSSQTDDKTDTMTEAEPKKKGNIVVDVILPLAIAFIMFSLGIGLKVSDFKIVIT